MIICPSRASAPISYSNTYSRVLSVRGYCAHAGYCVACAACRGEAEENETSQNWMHALETIRIKKMLLDGESVRLYGTDSD